MKKANGKRQTASGKRACCYCEQPIDGFVVKIGHPHLSLFAHWLCYWNRWHPSGGTQ
jgi:hypothetical protein